MRRHWILGLLLLLLVQMGRAEGLKMREVFKQMPDSLLPYLSENNRLDFIDFIDSKTCTFKKQVKFQIWNNSDVMKLLELSRTLQKSLMEGICSFTSLMNLTKGGNFTSSWQLLNEPPSISVSDQNTISSKKVQTILKRDDKILKKN